MIHRGHGHDEEVLAGASSSCCTIHRHEVPQRRDRFHCAPHRSHEVSEEDFFHKGESRHLHLVGYTKHWTSSPTLSPVALEPLCLPLLRRRQFRIRQPRALRARRVGDLCTSSATANQAAGSRYYESSMLHIFRTWTRQLPDRLDRTQGDIWPSFKAFLAKGREQSSERTRATAGTDVNRDEC